MLRLPLFFELSSALLNFSRQLLYIPLLSSLTRLKIVSKERIESTQNLIAVSTNDSTINTLLR